MPLVVCNGAENKINITIYYYKVIRKACDSFSGTSHALRQLVSYSHKSQGDALTARLA